MPKDQIQKDKSQSNINETKQNTYPKKQELEKKTKPKPKTPLSQLSSNSHLSFSPPKKK